MILCATDIVQYGATPVTSCVIQCYRCSTVQYSATAVTSCVIQCYRCSAVQYSATAMTSLIQCYRWSTVQYIATAVTSCVIQCYRCSTVQYIATAVTSCVIQCYRCSTVQYSATAVTSCVIQCYRCTYWAECGQVSVVSRHPASTDVHLVSQRWPHVLDVRLPHVAIASFCSVDCTDSNTWRNVYWMRQCSVISEDNWLNLSEQICFQVHTV